MASLMRFVIGLSLLAIVHGASLFSRTDPDPTKYSACYADRGYTKDDAIIAGNYLVQNATFEKGVYLTKNECIYRLSGGTVVSVCNGAARNRTINRGEVSRGIEQLQKDCGAGGTFNGVHVVNNLTFAAYGVTGARPTITPPGSPNPDTPTRLSKRDYLHSENSRKIHSRQVVDNCRALGFSGVAKYDCLHKNYLAPDGSCGGELNDGNLCSLYCEVRRTGFLGVEQTLEGTDGNAIPAGTGIQLTDGIESTVSHGFSLGAEGIFKEVFSAGVTYEYSYSITKTKSVTRVADNIPDNTFGRWVIFPKFIESCGTITRREYIPPLILPCGAGCIPVPGPGLCTGDVETLGNQCTLTPEIVDGVAQSIWVLRLEDLGGKILPISQQSTSYKTLCWQNRATPPTGDPDNDGEIECQAPASFARFSRL